MKKTLILIALLAGANCAYSQNAASGTKAGVAKASSESQNANLIYGPLPYRTLKETIGETYMVLPLFIHQSKQGYSNLKKTGKKLVNCFWKKIYQ